MLCARHTVEEWHDEWLWGDDPSYDDLISRIEARDAEWSLNEIHRLLLKPCLRCEEEKR